MLSLNYSEVTVRHEAISYSLTRSYVMLSDHILIVTGKWYFLLILLSGDIHWNPGPSSASDSSSISDISSSHYMDMLSNGLSIMHLNIQSIRSKMDILEIEAQPYDVLILYLFFTETWLNNDIDSEDIRIPNFSLPFRCDRVGKAGGGVAIYLRDSFQGHIRHDLSIINLEAIWVEIKYHGQNLLIGGFYRPPSANNNYFTLIEESFNRAYSTNFDNIVIAGDFNSDFMNDSHSKMKNLILSYNFNQIITDPTHFTESSHSLIDIVICKNVGNVMTSFVSDPFIPDLVRYHCPVVVVLKFNKSKHHVFQRHIWLYERGDYDNFRRIIKSTKWETIINPNDLDSTANSLTNVIIDAAKLSI